MPRLDRALALPGLALLATVAIAAASFSPFDFDVDLPRYETNHVERLPDGTLRFTVPSAARTTEAPDWIREAIDTSDVTVVVEARSLNPNQDGPARLFTVSEDYTRRNLTIGQDGPDLIVRVQRPGTDLNGLPDLRVRGVFVDDEWHRVVVDVSGNRLVLAVDDTIAAEDTFQRRAFSRWHPGSRLALGDELIGGRGWAGEIREARVTVGERTVDYLAEGALSTPEHFWYVPERVRSLVASGQFKPVDLLTHAVAFALLGAIYAAAGYGRLRLYTVLAIATLVVLLVEAGQLFFYGRHPTLADVAVNSLGAAAAIVVVFWALEVWAGRDGRSPASLRR